MRALSYHGTRDVRVDTVPDPILQHPQDILLRVTATADTWIEDVVRYWKRMALARRAARVEVDE